ITAANAAKVRALTPIDRNVWRIVCRPDGEQIAFLRWDKLVEVHDAGTLVPISTIAGKLRVMSFAFSSDKDVVALCVYGRKTEIWNLRTAKKIRLEPGELEAVLAFSPDGRLLATGNFPTGANLWDAAPGRLVRSLDMGPEPGPPSFAFRPDGKV